MGAASGFRNCIAFLTVLPVGMDEDGFAQAAWYMPLFPIVGALIGFIVGLFVWALNLLLPSTIAGILGLGLLLLITGVHHTDGLLDFGDAIMSHGSPEKKIRIMHDLATGAGGFAVGFMVLLTTGLAIGALKTSILIPSLVASEVAAKYALVFQASGAQSAAKGMNTQFVVSMHQKSLPIRFAFPLALLLVFTVPFMGILSLACILAGVLSPAILILVANRQFGGITGDVMGATNDVTRMISLLLILVASKWV